MNKLLIALVIALLAGCATAPSSDVEVDGGYRICKQVNNSGSKIKRICRVYRYGA
jgi:hypothetical protein